LGLEDFMGVVSGIATIAESIMPESRLQEDLGLDSLDILVLVTEIEDRATGGREMPERMVARMATVRDAFLIYCEMSQWPSGDSDETH